MTPEGHNKNRGMLSSMGKYYSGLVVGGLLVGIWLLAGFENPWRGLACQMAVCWV